MEFTNIFINSARNAFIPHDSEFEPSYLSLIRLDDTSPINAKSFVVDLSKTETDIPVFASKNIRDLLASYRGEETELKKVVIPLYQNSVIQNKRTFNTIIDLFFCRTGLYSRLNKCITSKGEIYYGCKGLILDEHFNPLILCTFKINIDKGDDSNTLNLHYIRPIVYINPKVFIEPNKLINKGIIKYILPYYGNSNMELNYPERYHIRYYDISKTNFKALIIIDDSINDFFVSPCIPNPRECSNESLNNCLVDNMDEIITNICHYQ